MNISESILYIGVNDKEIDLFEGQYKVPNGISYNSYAIIDEKIAIMDSTDAAFANEWLANLKNALGERMPDYLIVQHMEPDHSANVFRFLNEYPEAKVVASAKAFSMMLGFFGTDFPERRIVIKDGDTLSLGSKTLSFIAAPMVHWPEVIMTYLDSEKVLFTADAFGKFGVLDIEEDWRDEARRYYIGIVGKYGVQVQNLLKKAAALDIKTICPLHGPVLKENIDFYINLYNIWSSYKPEENGVVIAYASVYGNTRSAALKVADGLRDLGIKVAVYDLARCDMSQAVADAFRYSDLVLASTTYNADVFPPMREFINHLCERNFQNRSISLIENGSWAPMAARVMRTALEGCKSITFNDVVVTISSSINEKSAAQLNELINSFKNN